MMYHAGSRYDHLTAKDVDAPNVEPPRCALADSATVVPGSRWAGWEFNSRLGHDPRCARWASNGWTMEHKIGSKWYVVAQGSEIPTHVPGVPQRIALDVVRGLG